MHMLQLSRLSLGAVIGYSAQKPRAANLIGDKRSKSAQGPGPHDTHLQAIFSFKVLPEQLKKNFGCSGQANFTGVTPHGGQTRYYVTYMYMNG